MRFSTEIYDLKNLENPALGVAGGRRSNKSFVWKECKYACSIASDCCCGFKLVGAIGTALKDDSYSSDYGIKGIFRTTIIFVLPLIGRLIDVISGIRIVVAVVEVSGFLFIYLS
ncbi:hypothetical protein [Priestia megaterium]|uniref:hypothetical protein n=1 Tax=Priestia megaterium TaxID=1404 RepID=UPI002E1A3114|nr:hypothetical protein [Priestia megaterium]